MISEDDHHTSKAPRNGGGGPDRTFSFSTLASEALGGTVGLAPCPGWRAGRFHAELLGPDLDAVADWGPAAVICLLEPGEIDGLGVDRLSYEVRSRGIGWLHLPIADRQAPDAQFEREWARISGRLMQALKGGNRVLVHCVGGLGRGGLFAARLLIAAGTKADAAIAEVRAARPGAIETPEQEDYLRTLPRRDPG